MAVADLISTRVSAALPLAEDDAEPVVALIAKPKSPPDPSVADAFARVFVDEWRRDFAVRGVRVWTFRTAVGALLGVGGFRRIGVPAWRSAPSIDRPNSFESLRANPRAFS